MGVTRLALQLAAPLRKETSGEALAIERARRDPEAFGELYRAHYHAIAAYFLRRTGDEALAEDLAADTFIAALQGLKRYRDTGAGFRAWLYRIAANTASRWYTRSGAQRVRNLAHAEANAGERDENSHQIALVREAIETLSERDKAVLTLAYFAPMTTAQIALVLRVPEGTVKSRLARARQALGAQIERLTKEEGERP